MPVPRVSSQQIPTRTVRSMSHCGRNNLHPECSIFYNFVVQEGARFLGTRRAASPVTVHGFSYPIRLLLRLKGGVVHNRSCQRAIGLKT